MKTITEQIRSDYSLLDDDSAREASLQFWQRIVEDLTGVAISEIEYRSDLEVISVTFTNEKHKILLINIWGDSLSTCTADVIRQTMSWMEWGR